MTVASKLQLSRNFTGSFFQPLAGKLEQQCDDVTHYYIRIQIGKNVKVFDTEWNEDETRFVKLKLPLAEWSEFPHYPCHQERVGPRKERLS